MQPGAATAIAPPAGTAVVSLDGRFMQVDRQIETFLGRPSDALLRCRFQDITHPEDLLRDLAQTERLLAQGHGSYSLLKRYLRPRGGVVWAELEVMLRCGADGRATDFVGRIRETRIAPATLEDLHRRALRDPLTGLLDRSALDDQLIAVERRARRTGRPFGLLALDLDGFKLLNDCCGHAGGDRVLAEVAGRLAACAEPGDIVARAGGDEFAVLIQHLDGRDALPRRCARIAAAFARPVMLRDGPHRIAASIGTAAFPSDAASIPALLARADAEMYRRKRAAFACRPRLLH